MFLLVLATSTLYAEMVPSSQGAYFKGPMKLTGEKIGASIWLPLTWKTLPLQATKKTKSLVLVHQEKALSAELYPSEYNAFEAVQYLQKNIILPTGVLLTPLRRVQKISSSIYKAYFNESNINTKRKVIAYVVLGPQHRSINLFGFYDLQDEAAMESYMLKFVKSVSFTPMKHLHTGYKNLEDKIAGGRFVYYSQKGGYSTKKEIWLCSDRRYIMHKNHMETYGTWRIQDGQLIFKHHDAMESFVDIEAKGSAIYFSGVRVYRLGNRKCR